MVLLHNAEKLFVFPSLYEAFGLPPLETMTYGTPVVSSNATSLKEIVGDAGVLVSPRDVMGMIRANEQILASPEVRQQLIEKGFERVKQFHLQSTSDGILSEICSMLDKVS